MMPGLASGTEMLGVEWGTDEVGHGDVGDFGGR